MKIEAIKMYAYKMKMKLIGYKILENPKGTPPYVVRAIRYAKGINDDTLDTFEMYSRITKTFDKKNSHKKDEHFFRNNYAFFNREKHTIDYKTNVEYTSFSTDGTSIVKNRYQIDSDELDKRDFSYVNTIADVTDFTNSRFVSKDSLKTYGEIVLDKFYNNLVKS